MGPERSVPGRRRAGDDRQRRGELSRGPVRASQPDGSRAEHRHAGQRADRAVRHARLVLLSFPLGHPLDLLFSTFEILSVVLAVAIVAYLVLNGESNWFEGVQLLALYTMIAVAIYFLPSS